MTEYDYINQAWLVDGKYVACTHPQNMNCTCYGKRHAGESRQRQVTPGLRTVNGEDAMRHFPVEDY